MEVSCPVRHPSVSQAQQDLSMREWMTDLVGHGAFEAALYEADNVRAHPLSSVFIRMVQRRRINQLERDR